MSNSRWLTMTILLLVAALGCGVLVVVYAVSLAKSPGFTQLVPNPYVQVLDYPFSLEHVDCDILIYGDSAAMTGLDPGTIEQQRHLKTCNIAQMRPVIALLGTLPVDHYLSRNKAPKYLVIQMSPETFYFDHGWEKVSTFEPITLLLRQRSGAITYWELAKHPLQTFRFAKTALMDRYLPDRKVVTAYEQSYSHTVSDYYKTRGLLSIPKPPASRCQYGEFAFDFPVDTKWIEDVRNKYSARGIKVLVNVSAVPECDKEIAFYRKTLLPHVDDELQVLPISLFNESDRHFTPEGVSVVSTSLSKQIEDLEARKGTIR
jgi:hypothetical protein